MITPADNLNLYNINVILYTWQIISISNLNFENKHHFMCAHNNEYTCMYWPKTYLTVQVVSYFIKVSFHPELSLICTRDVSIL